MWFYVLRLKFSLPLRGCQCLELTHEKRNVFHTRMVEVKYDWESGGLSSFDSVDQFSVHFVANTDHITAHSVHIRWI